MSAAKSATAPTVPEEEPAAPLLALWVQGWADDKLFLKDTYPLDKRKQVMDLVARLQGQGVYYLMRQLQPGEQPAAWVNHPTTP